MASLPRISRLFAGPGPNPDVVKLALAAKGMDVKAITRRLTLKGGVPENRLPEYTQLNPAATTPFVELEDGTYLAESVAICRYADVLFAHDTTKPLLLGGPCPRNIAVTEMWQKRVELQIVSNWQRQFQYGEGADYFCKFVPWVDASRPAVPGLRKMVVENLKWLEGQMQARAKAGDDTGFIAGSTTFSLADLQLLVTADFMGDKVNTAKLTESFDARESFGPWLNDWAARMREIIKGLRSA